MLLKSLDDPKASIKQIVADYKQLFPDEYQIVIKGIQATREMTKDDYASFFDESSSENRALYEISETLHGMFVNALSEEELKWLKSGGLNHKEGGRWFARTFPEFALPTKI